MAEAKQHSRKKKFIKDLGVYAIGNLGSKVITFLMVPLYTYFVEKPSDYGYFDLCLQICLLMTPIVTLQLRDGAFRFLLDSHNKTEQKCIISFAYQTLFFTILAITIIAILLSLFYPIRHLSLIVLLMIVIAIDEVVAQIVRGLGKNTIFVSMGLIASFSIGFFSLIFVAFLKLGILGIFIANILARLLSTIFAELKIKTISHYYSTQTDLRIIRKEILKYCLPLIPVTLCSLVPHLSDRLFIKHYLGFEQAGLYAIAVRSSGIIHSLSIIFYQTWQENAIQQYRSNDRDLFFSKIFNSYIFVLSIILITYIFILKVCYNWIVAPNYQTSVLYIYPLGFSMVIAAIGNYFYLPYQCAKDTRSAIPSVIIVATLNILFNFLLVPTIGVFGVICTAIIAYSAMTFYLWCDTRKYFTLHLNIRTIIPVILMFSSFVPFYCFSNHILDIAYVIVCFSILFLALPSDLKTMIHIKKK